MQVSPEPERALLADTACFTELLTALKDHEDTYVAAILALRQDYLSHGRTRADIAEATEDLRQRAKRAYARATDPDLAAAARLVRGHACEACLSPLRPAAPFIG